MSKRNAGRWILYITASAIGALGVLWFFSAALTADMRFGQCGPSTINHVDTYCQVATRITYRSYSALTASALLFVAGFYVGRRSKHAA